MATFPNPTPYYVSGSTIAANNINVSTITSANIIGTTSTGGTVYVAPVQGHWYRYTHYECPLCGTVDVVKQRVYSRDESKPSDEQDRHIYKEIPCGYHFT